MANTQTNESAKGGWQTYSAFLLTLVLLGLAFPGTPLAILAGGAGFTILGIAETGNAGIAWDNFITHPTPMNFIKALAPTSAAIGCGLLVATNFVATATFVTVASIAAPACFAGAFTCLATGFFAEAVKNYREDTKKDQTEKRWQGMSFQQKFDRVGVPVLAGTACVSSGVAVTTVLLLGSVGVLAFPPVALVAGVIGAAALASFGAYKLYRHYHPTPEKPSVAEIHAPVVEKDKSKKQLPAQPTSPLAIIIPPPDATSQAQATEEDDERLLSPPPPPSGPRQGLLDTHQQAIEKTHEKQCAYSASNFFLPKSDKHHSNPKDELIFQMDEEQREEQREQREQSGQTETEGQVLTLQQNN